MAAKWKGNELVTLAVDVRHHGELFPAGLQFLGNDELVRSRPELFARFALGHREVVAVREALERAEVEEERERRVRAEAAAPKEKKPAGPAMVVALKRFTDNGHVVEPGELWRADHPTVLAAENAFAPVQN